MPTQVKVWEISGRDIEPRENKIFADSHREEELEAWIAQRPEILGEKLLIIGKQLRDAEVGRLDLLGMDANGRLVIIELKRGMATREAVAQALDYASWLNASSEEWITAQANVYLQ